MGKKNEERRKGRIKERKDVKGGLDLRALGFTSWKFFTWKHCSETY